jgi:predicted ATPase
MQRIVITGAPGTGKTTLVNLLHEQGYTVHPEMARALIKEQQELDTHLLPWENHPLFGAELFKRQLAQYQAADPNKINIYDRGIPDNLGYLRRDGFQNELLEKKAANFPYYSKVFFTPPWQDIYAQDEERKEDFSLMLEIDEALQDIYRFYNYHLVEVPRASPQERLKFVLFHINQF